MNNMNSTSQRPRSAVSPVRLSVISLPLFLIAYCAEPFYSFLRRTTRNPIHSLGASDYSCLVSNDQILTKSRKTHHHQRALRLFGARTALYKSAHCRIRL